MVGTRRAHAPFLRIRATCLARRSDSVIHIAYTVKATLLGTECALAILLYETIEICQHLILAALPANCTVQRCGKTASGQFWTTNPYYLCRRLEAEDQLRQRQADWAAQQRAEEIKRKADILDSRIKRGIRVRRARELRNEREAAKRADEREAAVEAAKR